jgi:predicted O-methyltransferase YrrM
MGHTAHSVVDWTGYLFHEEVDALQQLARALPDKPHVVNIGAGNGTSGLAFMEARPDLHLYTIDIQLESSPFGCLAGEEAVFRDAGCWGDPRHQQIHGDSKEVGRRWPQEWGVALDLVFVDGGHQYHETLGDLTLWLPLLKPGGIMAVHDYEKTTKVWPGVDRAVREVLVGKYEKVLQVATLIAFRTPEVAPV